jgi:hypothetical protein
MFGGLTWLLNGNMLLAARRHGILVRLGKDNDARALALPNIAPMIMRDRPMLGWVRTGPDAYGNDALRARLIAATLSQEVEGRPSGAQAFWRLLKFRTGRRDGSSQHRRSDTPGGPGRTRTCNQTVMSGRL